MKIAVATLCILLIAALLLCHLWRQDAVASNGQQQFSFSAFEKSTAKEAGDIITFRQQNALQKEAAATVAYTDILLGTICALYLCGILLYHRKRTTVKWPLTAAFICVLLALIFNLIKDSMALYYNSDRLPQSGLEIYYLLKWILIALGIIVCPLISYYKNTSVKIRRIDLRIKIPRLISQFLRSLWLFFPGILLLLLPVACFWILGQGKDILVAFAKNSNGEISAISFNFTPLIFFVAIAFWVYVSWYASRILAYIKKFRQKEDIKAVSGWSEEKAEKLFQADKTYFNIGIRFLNEFPRIVGNACFLVLEMAVLQSPVLQYGINGKEAFLFLVIISILFHFINKWIESGPATRPWFKTTFYTLLLVFGSCIIIACFIMPVTYFRVGEPMLWILFILIVFLHILFIMFINLRRIMMKQAAPALVARINLAKDAKKPGLIFRVMNFFCIPLEETNYFKYYQVLFAIAMVLYLSGICCLWFARNIGPFPFIILAFGVLLGFLYLISAFSVKCRINFHFVIFIAAIFVSSFSETHLVKTVDFPAGARHYTQRPGLKQYLKAWLKERAGDTAQNKRIDMYFVLANGGASRSGYWTAAVLGKLEDSTITNDSAHKRFSDHLFCLSGTSGGGVGVATFFSLLRNKTNSPHFQSSAQSFLKQDYFTYTFARMLGPDFFKYVFPISKVDDRAAALEYSIESSARQQPEDSNFRVPFDDSFANFSALTANEAINLPVLLINTTRVQDGKPGLVSNLKIDDTIFNGRIDVAELLPEDKDITITSAAILGARFPYLSPAGKIGDSYFVDGGYFDNSGAGAVQELIRGIITIANEDPELSKLVSKINFKVIHIINSPDGGEMLLKPVSPLKNDMLSPLLTIMGAYDMQTTVNDGRLQNYIKDLQAAGKSAGSNTSYQKISLYEDAKEWREDTVINRRFKNEPPYAMNWFISDTTLFRINKRLSNCSSLKTLIDRLRQ